MAEQCTDCTVQYCKLVLFCVLKLVQERLLTKLGKNAYPFHLEFPTHSPNSVTLVLSNEH